MEILIQFGNAVRARRHEIGLSQEKLAERTGLHRTYISDVERGARNISLLNILKILDALEIEISTFFKNYYQKF